MTSTSSNAGSTPPAASPDNAAGQPSAPAQTMLSGLVAVASTDTTQLPPAAFDPPSSDDGPVSVVGTVKLDIRDIETIEREFAGKRVHSRDANFDLFGDRYNGAKAISSSESPTENPSDPAAVTTPRP